MPGERFSEKMVEAVQTPGKKGRTVLPQPTITPLATRLQNDDIKTVEDQQAVDRGTRNLETSRSLRMGKTPMSVHGPNSTPPTHSMGSGMPGYEPDK